MRRLIFPLVIAALTLAASVASGEESLASGLDTMTQKVESLSEAGRHDEAIAFARSALDLARQTHGETSRQMAQQLRVLAGAYRKARNIPAAIAQLERAVGIDERIHGLNSMLLAADLNTLGGLYFSEKKLVQARISYARSVNILLQVTRGEGDMIADAYFNLALTIRRLGDGEADEERLHKRSLRIREKIGSESYEAIARSHVALGDIAEEQFRYAEAEVHFRAALNTREKLADFDKEELGSNAYRLADVLYSLERYDESEPFFARALHLLEQSAPQNARGISYAQLGLAQVFYHQSRYEEAEAMGMKALAGAETWIEADSLYLNKFREALALAKTARGNYSEATKLLEKNIATRIRHRGENDKFLTYMYPALIESLLGEQKFAEAEKNVRFMLEFSERTIGSGVFVAPNLVDLIFSQSARLLEVQGRLEEAEAQYRRVLDTYDMYNRVTGKGGDWDEASFLVRFVTFLDKRGKWDEASGLVERAERIAADLYKTDSVNVADIYDAKAMLLRRQRKFAQAEGLLAKSLALRQKFLRPDHPALGRSYADLASIATELGRLPEAADYYRRAFAISEKAYGADKRETAVLYGEFGALFLKSGKTGEAKYYLERAARIQLNEIDGSLLPAGVGNTDIGNLVGNLYDFDGLIKVNHALEAESRAVLGDMFKLSQWGHSSATAFALGQMSARQGTGNSELGAMVRERQDLLREYQALDGKLIELISLPYMQRKEANEKEVRKSLASVGDKIKAADAAVEGRFSSYAALANPRPLTIADVQALLDEDEVLLSYVDTKALPPLPAETFVWVISKRGKPRWVKLPLRPDEIGGKVSVLRDLLGVGSTARAAVPIADSAQGAFDLAVSHELYQAVLAPVATEIAGKQLIIVPSKNLSSLPFHLLVSKPADPAVEGNVAYQQAQWLIRDHAISMLPSVASLKALRGGKGGANAAKPYLGFGNPLLTGADGTSRRAWQAQHCRSVHDNRPTLVAARDVLNDRGVSRFFRGNRANVAELRKLAPLPETVDELCEVARSLKGSETDLYLGARATERNLKELSAEGTLSQARIVHFATHGLVAGDLDFLAEPALVLTPPDDPTDEDDGLLTASEVTQLKLNADWIILSACNTAAGGGNDAEALSGLARAFFYAGTRGLLVSHWPVNSEAAVEITTGAINRLSAQPGLGRAEALRQTLVALIDRGGEHARPAYWAPFVIVGEGN